MKKTIGIIGGMGPLATADLFKKIVLMTKADTDQQHLHILIDNNTNIPDRTAAILSGEESPMPELTKSIRRLEGAGADFLIIPCNTAHYFYNQMTAETSLPILNMLEETAKEVAKRGMRKVGLLATNGTIESGVYDRAFQKYGITALKPSEENQKHVLDLIYNGVKASNLNLDTAGFIRAMDELEAAGAETLILGCTELPLAFEMFHFDRKHVDPTAVLAAAAIVFAGGTVRQ